jgi:UDP:flavonoid glycosyltransferase YjiC (YdhE family)
MRLLFTTFPWHSHHFPMVPLEWACQTAGHEVRVASTPSLIDTIVESGLPAVPVGADIELPKLAADSSRAGWHRQSRWPQDWPVRPETLGPDRIALIENLGRMQATMAAAMVGDLVDFAREWEPDLIVHDAVSLAGPVAAAAIGVPNVSHAWGTPFPQRIEIQDFGRGAPLPEYTELFARFGAQPRLAPTAWIDPCPPSMRYATAADETCLPMRYVPYNGPGILPDWLLTPPAGRRICLTWGGTTEALVGEDFLHQFRQALEAAQSFDAEVVVAVGDRLAGHLTDIGDRVRVVSGLPLHLLLPSCDAVVHHGGSGTMLTAATHAVPQLTVTRRPEPTVNGLRLAHTGAGRCLPSGEVPAGEPGVALLRAELAHVLEDGACREAAARLRDEILRQPAPPEVVPHLIKLI